MTLPTHTHIVRAVTTHWKSAGNLVIEIRLPVLSVTCQDTVPVQENMAWQSQQALPSTMKQSKLTFSVPTQASHEGVFTEKLPCLLTRENILRMVWKRNFLFLVCFGSLFAFVIFFKYRDEAITTSSHSFIGNTDPGRRQTEGFFNSSGKNKIKAYVLKLPEWD